MRHIGRMAKVVPSVLAADFSRLADEIRNADEAGATMLHLDIMDGHFVPNISFGPEIVQTINELTECFLDVHLMLSEPEKYFRAFAEAGADNITFHLEVHPEPVEHADRIRYLGPKAGISINPNMPIDRVLPFLEHFDYLLIMSVFPGFGGQEFMREALPKIRAAREYIDRRGLGTEIEVDGGLGAGNAADVIDAGADVLVMGTAFFRAVDRKALVDQVAGHSPKPQT